jgi:hypothetical protein
VTVRAFGRDLDRRELEVLGRGLVDVTLLEHLDGAARGSRTLQIRVADLDVELSVDRGLDIGRAAVAGVPVSWMPPAGLVAPGLVEAGGWGPLRTFHGGLLTTCGIDHVGVPVERDGRQYHYPVRPSAGSPVHGRFSATPATLRRHEVDWEEGAVVVEADVAQASLFGEHLVVRRRVRVGLDARSLSVRDVVRNAGYAPEDIHVLYHVNLGWPLVGPDLALDADAAGSGDPWRRPTSIAEPGERVWAVVPRTPSVSLAQPDIGDGRSLVVQVGWDLGTTPRFGVWQVAMAGHHVVAVEPCTPPPGDPLAVRLEPGEERVHTLEVALAVQGGLEDGR